MRHEVRLILAVALSTAVLLGYYRWFAPPAPVPSPPGSGGVSVPTAPSLTPMPTHPSSAIAPSLAPAAAPSVPERTVAFENDSVKAVFSTHGARLAHWELKDYHEGIKKKSPRVALLSEQEDLAALEIDGLTATHLPFELVGVTELEKTWAVHFRAQKDGLEVQKKFILYPQGQDVAYRLDLEVKLSNHGEQSVRLHPTLLWQMAAMDPEQKGFLAKLAGPPDQRTPVALALGKMVRQTDWKTALQTVTDTAWVGIEQRYFVAALVGRQGASHVAGRAWREGERVSAVLDYGEEVLPAGSERELTYTAYLGPKDIDTLKPMGVGLERAIDYGWFSSISMPLLWLLKIFHSFLKNWGLAIIALTVVVKVLLYPLSKKSMQSMKAMQQLQPQLTKLREKYQNDRQRLNVEMMQLFRTYKVNPASGCLPLVVQTPVYIALYKVLYNSIELYHAPFFAWYHDLSSADPYFIAPALTTLFMVAQQAMTPNVSVDPAQRTMMKIMPIMFGLLMIMLPVGLVVYILVNMVLTVIQQYMTQHDIRMRDLPQLTRKGFSSLVGAGRAG